MVAAAAAAAAVAAAAAAALAIAFSSCDSTAQAKKLLARRRRFAYGKINVHAVSSDCRCFFHSALATIPQISRRFQQQTLAG